MNASRFKKISIYFVLFLLIGLGLSSTISSNESKDNNQIKCLSYSNLPYYLEPNNSTNKLDSDTIFPSKEFGNQTQPAISSNNNSHFVAYNDEVAGEIMWGTINGDKYNFLTDGGSYPSLKHWNDTTFYGTFVCTPQFYSGAAIPLCKIPNPEDPNTFSLAIWNWESYGWYNITDSELACDSSMENWNFGYISFVGSTTFGEGIINGPFIFYLTDEYVGQLSWLVQYDNCSHTDACIDHQTKYAYSIFDQFNGNQWQLVIREDNFANQMLFLNDYVIGGNQNLTYPKISVQNDHMVIVSETDQNGNKDIVCFFNTPNNPQQVLITTSDVDERFPEIIRIDNTTYICSFISNNTLYYSISSSGGQTWSHPIKMSGNVYESYKSIDLSERLDYIGYESINGSDIDILFDNTQISIIYVDDDFDTTTPGWNVTHFNSIQDGIDAVDENGTVYVFNGTYFESIVINKTISLIGEDRNNTIIEGNNENFIIYISADFTNIMNFEIKNNSFWSLARGIDIHANYTAINNNFCNNLRFGIYVAGLNNTIKNNNISSINYVGIHISSDNNYISNNYVNSNGHCIFLDYAENNVIHQNHIPGSLNVGVYLDFSDNNEITNNTINFHGGYGLYFDASINNIIRYNNISNNNLDGCIILGGTSTNNSIIENHIYSNNRFGIQIVSSSNNYVFHNEFNDNNKNAKDTGSNFWDNGYPSGGNYWNDYNGTDEDGDGIGDIAYDISNGDNQDRYPLGYFHPIANFTYYPSNPIVQSMVYFNDTSIDPDGSIESWFWDYGNGDTSTSQNPHNVYLHDMEYTCCLTVTDNDGKNHTYCQIINVSSGLDVNQSVEDRGFPIRHAVDGDWAAAQSFTPTIDTLTRTEILLRKFGTPEFNLTVELRTDDPQGTLIDSKSYTPDQVSSSWEMFEVNFNDTIVINDTDYFIVIPPAPSGVTTSFGYEWGYAFGDKYPDGAFWFTRDGGGLWRDLPTMYEFAFRTYGYS